MTVLERITAKLNPAQKKAVETLDGPLLVLAGAGSGKTGVLTRRIAALIATGKAAPDEILAVTFTNKAAREMESRISRLLSDLDYFIREPLWVSTFHSLCAKLLRRHIELLEFKTSFVILDDGDQLSILKKIVQQLGLDDKLHPPKAFRSRISNAKMLGLTPSDVMKSPRFLMDQRSVEIYQLYEAELKKTNCLDFDDLLLKMLELFKMYPAILESYQDKFKYILVDEYQDTNHVQYQLIAMLAKKNRNLCVVGDEDQSIYSWRGADISNILDFEKDFPECQSVKLEQNYRSSKNIVTAASHLIQNNLERKTKVLFTDNPAGEKIQIREELTDIDEAKFIINKITSLCSEAQATYNDIAIFYRTNAQSRLLEEQLRMRSIPYKLLGGVRFYERMEVKDLLCYLRLIFNPSDDMAFRRILNAPSRGIGKTTLEKLEEQGFKSGLSLTATARLAVDNREFHSGTTSKLRQFLILMDDLRAQSETLPLLDLYTITVDKTEYVKRLKIEGNVEADQRIQNLEELGNAIGDFAKERPDANLQSFLEEMALISDLDKNSAEENAVTMMTLHLSKGLEYPVVFIAGLEETLFPSLRAMNENEESEVEEERRLAYVGLTRAEKRLYLTYAKSRRVWGQEQWNPPSRFLNELPQTLVEFSSGAVASRFATRMSKINHDVHHQDFPDYDSPSIPRAQPLASETKTGFSKGVRVRHPTFGPGSVFEVDGSGDEMKISVLFADQTIKKFVAKYARLEKI